MKEYLVVLETNGSWRAGQKHYIKARELDRFFGANLLVLVDPAVKVHESMVIAGRTIFEPKIYKEAGRVILPPFL